LHPNKVKNYNMILTDKEILKQIKRGDILIDPFDITNLGTNSYDVHLGKTLAVYEDEVLDAKQHNKIRSKGLIRNRRFLV